MEAALKAIVEPRRREILRLVTDGEMPAGEIASHFEITRPAVSQHLRVLKDAGLLNERRDGTRRLYRARPEGLSELKEYLEHFWDERLAELKRAAEEAEAKEGKRNGDEAGKRGSRGEGSKDRGKSRDHLRLLHRPGEDDEVEGD